MTERILYIGVAEAAGAAFAARARADFPGIDLVTADDREQARSLAGEAVAIIGHHFQFDEDMLARAGRLRWIQSMTTGTDEIVRLRNLRAEVVLTSTRGMHGPQMSELVFMQMLALLRDFPRFVRNQQGARFERWPQPLLLGRTVAIVGVGAISEALAPRCQAFGMRVLGVSGSPRLPPGFAQVLPRERLTEAAALADFLVIIVPYTPDTERLIDARVLAAMKPSAFVINVARGGVLDEQALLDSLLGGRLAGAALDVFRREPLPPDDPLWRARNLLITPHIGGMSDVYLEQAYGIVRQNLRCFLDGRLEAMRNIVVHHGGDRAAGAAALSKSLDESIARH